MRSVLAASVLASLLLTTPTASAARTSGSLVAEAPIELPPGTMVTSNPSALFATLGPSSEIELMAAAAHVLVFEKRYVSASAASLQPSVLIADQPASWTASDLRVRIAPREADAWMGLHARSGESRETSTTTTTTTLRSAPSRTVGNGRADPDNADPARPYYAVSLTTPTLSWTASDWHFAGDGLLKTMGSTLTLSTPSNTTTIQTGEFADPSRPGQIVRRWVALDLSSAEINGSSMQATLASPGVSATWDGDAAFGEATGSLQTTLTEWHASSPRSVRVSGAFHASLNAEPGGVTRAYLEGELRDSTMASSVRIAAPASIGEGSTKLLLLVVGAVLAAAGGAYLQRRRRTSSALEVEEYVRLAEAAADLEDYARAAHHVRAARLLSPKSRRLALDEAFFAAQAGEGGLAISILRERLLADDADAQLLLARLLSSKREMEGASRALSRALEIEPSALLDVETDPAYGELMRHDVVRRAAREARRRLG